MLERMYVIGAKVLKAIREIKVDNSDNPKDCKQVTPFGFDSIPIKGSDAVSSQSDRYRVILGYIQKAVDGLGDGESIQFSKDSSGNIVSKMICYNDGKMTIESNDTIDINNGNLTIEP